MSEHDLDELRHRLHETMADNGFTQTDVAKITGVSQSLVSRILRDGGTSARPDTIKRLRAFIGDEEHTEVLSHEEVRKAVRLYRYVKGVINEGSKITIRESDGTEKLLVFLW